MALWFERKDKKLQNKVQYIFTLVVILLAITFIVYYSFSSFYKITKEDVVKVGESSVAEESEKLNDYLRQGLDVLQVTGFIADHLLERGATSEEIEEFLVNESERYTQDIDENFTGIYGVFDGKYLDGTGWVPDADYVPEERVWYTDAVKGGGEPVIVSPYLDVYTNSIMISVSQLLSDGRSVISLDIVMEAVQTLAEKINLDEQGYGIIFDNTGLVIAHSDSRQKGLNYLESEDEQLRNLVKNVYEADEKYFEMDLDGEHCTVFSSMVRDTWYTVMVVRNEELFKPLRVTLLRNILLSLLIFAIVFYFCRDSYRQKKRASEYAERIWDYKQTLEDRVLEQTREIKEQTTKLVAMQQGVIEGMATLIESRDGNTGMHVLNTKEYVSMMVHYMYDHHMDEDEIDLEYIENICNAASLHDVGKIKIPDTILNKPGRFTPEEYEIMKTHSAIGGEIIAGILGKEADPKLLQISRDIATYHHEKWNGGGYPDGLSGKDIPLCARIMAVADVFDALVSKRVYKEGMPSQAAFEILEKDAGTHFDPELVQVFFAIREEVETYLKTQNKVFPT